MSNDVKALSISFRSDDGCIEHNNRDFFTENVDKSRTPNNTTYIKRDLRELYHELFDEALAEYNARQDRPDRQIPDYYEHIRKGKKEKLFQEIIVMFGDIVNIPLHIYLKKFEMFCIGINPHGAERNGDLFQYARQAYAICDRAA